MSDASPTPRRPTGRLLLGLAVSGAAIAWLAASVEPADVRALWAARRGGPLCAAALAYAGVHVLRGIRYRTVGVRLALPDLVTIAALHGFLNRMLPARTGELVYGVLVRRLGGASFSAGLVGLVLIRLLDAFTVASFFGIALLGYHGKLGFARAEGLALAAVALALMGGAYLLVSPALALISRLLAPLAARGERHRSLARLLSVLEPLADELAATPLIARLALLGTCVASWALSYVTYWLVLRGFSVELPLGTVVLGASIANLASSLPITLIGSFGALEAGWMEGFKLFGVEPAQAAATGIAFSLVTLAYSTAFASLAALRLATRRAEPRP